VRFLGRNPVCPSCRADCAALTVDFVLDGQEFTAIDGGPQFAFNESIKAMFGMKKLDIAALQAAADEASSVDS
jgi:3-demethylubiquinone-9 3-methyltransferase